jgi:AcrR family transcriptional regulator
MAKPGTRGRPPGEEAGRATRTRIVEAAIRTLKEKGFAGASARAIARTGGFNQALIFYHFGSINDLLLAALDETSARRMDSYRDVVDGARSLPELIDAAARIYREDLESGHIKVLAEIIGAASADPGMGQKISDRIEPWARLARRAIQRVVGASPVGALIPPEELAHGLVALYLGMELMTNLDGDRSKSEALFNRAAELAPMLSVLFAGLAEGGG